MVLFAVAIFLAIKFIKNVVAAIFTVFLISIVLVAGTGFFVYHDVNELQTEFPNSNNLLLLKQGDKILTGIVLLPSEQLDLINNMKMLKPEHIEALSNYLAKNDMNGMLSVVKSSDFLPENVLNDSGYNDETYKIVFVDYNVLKDAPLDKLDVSDITGNSGSILDPIPQEDVLNILDSETPWKDLEKYVVTGQKGLEQQIADKFKDMNFTVIETSNDELRVEILDGLRKQLVQRFATDDVKGLIFVMDLTAIVNSNGADGLKYIFSQYQNESIYLSKSSILFDLIKLSPNSLINAIVDQAGNAAGEMKDKVQEYTTNDSEQNIQDNQDGTDSMVAINENSSENITGEAMS